MFYFQLRLLLLPYHFSCARCYCCFSSSTRAVISQLARVHFVGGFGVFCRNDTTCQVWFIVNLFELASVSSSSISFDSIPFHVWKCACKSLHTRDNEHSCSHTSTVNRWHGRQMKMSRREEKKSETTTLCHAANRAQSMKRPHAHRQQEKP